MSFVCHYYKLLMGNITKQLTIGSKLNYHRFNQNLTSRSMSGM